MRTIVGIGVWLFLYAGLARPDALGADGRGILSNLVSKARLLESFHFTATSESSLDPTDSGTLTKTRITAKFDVLGMKRGARLFLCEKTVLIEKPLDAPGKASVSTNILIFDGSTVFAMPAYIGAKQWMRLDDPDRTCKMFLDPETCVSELLADSTVRYLGERDFAGRKCAVFETGASHFVGALGLPRGRVEVELFEESGIPARLRLKAKHSSGTWKAEQVELNLRVDDEQFTPPAGIGFLEAEVTKDGGFRFKDPNQVSKPSNDRKP